MSKLPLIMIEHIEGDEYAITCQTDWNINLQRLMEANGLKIVQMFSSFWTLDVTYIVRYVS